MQEQDTTESQLSITLGQLMAQAEENLSAAQPGQLALAPAMTVTTSGLYKWSALLKPAPGAARQMPLEPGKAGTPLALFPFVSEELSLDVDGRYALMVASGTISRFLAERVHWIANLQPGGQPHQWHGVIWHKDGDAASFPYTTVDIAVVASLFPSYRSATVTFSGGGAVPRQRVFKFASPYHHPVEFEFDATPDAAPVLTIGTLAHPNHPATLADEKLSIQKVYMRAGFDVKTSAGSGVVPLAGAGADGAWSDMEMHDTMQVYWSRFDNKAQWALWTLFAALHEQGSNLGGIMFDDIGPNHRQGTAIFTSAFIAHAPAGDPAPKAWVERMLFWTACHEMGHGFNLAHSWQKSLGTPWIPLANEPEARSFMNYPYSVAGGQTAFFADFEFRFSDAELLFMRHAPERFVQMGNAEWFDHHGFEQADVLPEPTFKLEARVNRAKAEFEFLEPIVLDLKLVNITSQPQILHQKVLAMQDRMTIVIKKDGQPARTHRPYAQYCWQPQNQVLGAAQTMYDSLFISAGANGWNIAEPGYYTVQIALHLEHEDIVSNAMRLRIAPPRSYDEEYIAQDYFSDQVGRILHFDGSRHLVKGIETLWEASERLADRRVAIHSKIALGNALAREFRSLEVPAATGTIKSAADAGGSVVMLQAETPIGNTLLAQALTANPRLAAETLSHIDYHDYSDRFSALLAQQDQPDEAAQIQASLHDTLAQRGVRPEVLTAIKANQVRYQRDSR